MQFNEDIFVIDCWTDTIEKKKTLIELITKLKGFNIPILLCGHYPIDTSIQSLVDYYLFDSNNDILLEKDFDKYGIDSDRWSQLPNYKIVNKIDFHHDYAIWSTMRNAFKFVESLGKKYIHFLEFDNLPDETQYRQSFIEYIRRHDAVIYEYDENSTKVDNPYCATYIFTIKTDIANKVISKINTKDEYFKNKPNKWQLEKVFYQTLKDVTDNVFVSEYIPNDDELNIYAAWNRNGILRNGARFQTYLGVNGNDLFIHFISGFDGKPANQNYLVEVVYGEHKKFYTIEKGFFYLEHIGNYNKGETVKVYYQGVEVFSELLKDDVIEFERKNKVTKLLKDQSKTKVNLNFIDGPFVEILNENDSTYKIEFINLKNNKVEYETTLKSNHWAKCSIKYYVDWLIKITGVDNDFKMEHRFNPKNQRVLISFESKSLGDNLAWIPYVEEFRKKHKCKVICSTFQNPLFKKQYPEIEFMEPGNNAHNIYALFRLGMFYKTNDNGSREIDYHCHLTDPKGEPLTKLSSDILGLDYVEKKPKLEKLGKKKQKRVCIAIHSTAQCKYWNNPVGWQEVVDYLNNKGYEVRLLSREEDGYMGNIHPNNITKQPEGSLNDIIKTLQESELFIGISSGLSWLSWAANVPTILISGFTDVYTEPFDGINRVINKEVCNSCWNKYDFDPGDWNWCPVHKNTDRQFECSKNITSNLVIKEIDSILS